MPIAALAVITDEPRLRYRRFRLRSKKRFHVRTSSEVELLGAVGADEACLVMVVEGAR